MNTFPKWWDTTVTIYNKYKDPDTKRVSWYKTVLPACFWKYTKDKLTPNNSVNKTVDALCRIPKYVLDGAIVGRAIVGKAIVGTGAVYLDRYLWEDVEPSEKSDYFTLGIGDIIIKGYVSDDIDEYTSGMRSSDFISKYKKLQGCMVIGDYRDNTGDKRGTEHYWVKGA